MSEPNQPARARSEPRAESWSSGLAGAASLQPAGEYLRSIPWLPGPADPGQTSAHDFLGWLQ